MLAFGGVIYYLSTKLPTPPPGKIGPSFFPQLLAAGFGVLALVLTVRGAMKQDSGEIKLDFDLKKPVTRNRIIVPVAMAIYIFVMQYIGFLISTFLFCSLLMVVFGTNYIRAAIVSAFVAVGIYYVFIVFMVVPLPVKFSLPVW